MSVEDRVAQLRLNHVFNIYHGKAPSYLCEHFLLRSEVSSRSTRSSSNLDFIVPRIKTCESGSFFYQGIKNWNELPKHIKEMKGKRSSSNLDFIAPRLKTCESGSFFYQGIKNWNELPKHIKEMKGKQGFKEGVKKHLMEKGLDKHNCDFYFY